MCRVLVSTAIGNSLEWFDFALFAYFGDQIGKQFFPPGEPATHIMESFGVFGSAFLTRPLGGLLFGYLGDKYGRVFALRVSILLMSIPTVMVGCLPTFEQVGMIAPFLLLLIRLTQGLSVGGEWIGSIVYIYEQAPLNRKGTYLSLNNACEFGFLLATAISALLRSVLTPAQLDSWGWRLPFFGGILAAFFGMWMRKGLGESEEFKVSSHRTTNDNPLKASLKNKMLIAILYGLISQTFVSYYLIWVYLATYVSHLRENPITEGFFINLVSMLFAKFTVVAWGYLGDRWHRGLLLQAGSTLIFLSAPAFFYVFSFAGTVGVLLAQMLLVVFVSLYEANVTPFMVQALPDIKSRYTSFGIAYNLAAATIGGSTPLIATVLATQFSPILPGVMFSLLALVGFVSVTLLRSRQEHVHFWLAIFRRVSKRDTHQAVDLSSDAFYGTRELRDWDDEEGN